MADNPNGPITVAQLIEHLKTLPQDLPVYGYSDEDGVYHPFKTQYAAVVTAEMPPDEDVTKGDWLWPTYEGQEPVPPERQVKAVVL